jgi:hypothetical protein
MLPFKHSRNNSFPWNTLRLGDVIAGLSTHDSVVHDWETVMKQSDLDSMSIDELFMLHERISATLAAKITAEKEVLIDQLKQADMSVH